MTIFIPFQQSGYRTFKDFDTRHVQVHLRAEFPQLVSYTRFVTLMPCVLLTLVMSLHTQLGNCTGISYVDSTAWVVCHNVRTSPHRVCRADTRRGKTAVGWFHGFRLHLVVNDCGELLAVCLMPGNDVGAAHMPVEGGYETDAVVRQSQCATPRARVAPPPRWRHSAGGRLFLLVNFQAAWRAAA